MLRLAGIAVVLQVLGNGENVMLVWAGITVMLEKREKLTLVLVVQMSKN